MVKTPHQKKASGAKAEQSPQDKAETYAEQAMDCAKRRQCMKCAARNAAEHNNNNNNINDDKETRITSVSCQNSGTLMKYK